jgi:hypothetical protein
LYLLVSFSSSEAVSFSCSFSFKSYDSVGQLYECSALAAIAGNSSWLTALKGSHTGERTNEDVEGFELKNQDVKIIPGGIDSFLPNLRAISWPNSNLWSIYAEDLQAFPILMHLNLENNKLISLDGDLFKYTPRLLYVNFNLNLLVHIEPEILKKAPFLKKAWFNNNPCISDYALNGYMTSINQQLQKCAPLETNISAQQKVNETLIGSA